MQKPITMPSSTKLVTAEEFARMPDDDYRYELVEGRVIRMPPPRNWHGVVVTNVAIALGQFVKAHNLGIVMTECGYKLASNPDTVRGPDASFIRSDRIPIGGLSDDTYWVGPPDLAVEVLSHDDRRSSVAEKIQEYLRVGVRMIWVIEPKSQTLTVYRPSAQPAALTVDQEVGGGDVVPGFRLRIRELFAELGTD